LVPVKPAHQLAQRWSNPMTKITAQQSADMFHVLGNQTRLVLLQELARRQEADVSTLTQALGTSQATVSNHLAILRHLQLVKPLRQGQHVLYRLHSPLVRRLLRRTCGW
jgi:DNA-binding transcriptional ArsR family regulator